MRILTAIVLTLALFACKPKDSSSFDQGVMRGEIYENDLLGWSLEVPEGWTVISRNQLEKQAKQGIGYVNDAVGAEIDISNLQYLVSFKKDDLNTFQSTAEPFDEDADGSWEDNQELLREVLYETYYYKGIKADTLSSVETIDGLKFDVFQIKVYGPLGNVVMTQRLYSSLINGYAFSAVVNYNNEGDGDEIHRIWRNSVFRR